MAGTDRQAGIRTLLAFGAAVGILTAAGIYAVRGEWPWRRPPATPSPPALAELFQERLDTLREGETVSHVFARQGLASFALSPESPRGLFDPRRLRPGLVLSFQTRSDDSVPSRVVFRSGPVDRVVLEPALDGWLATLQPIEWQSDPVTIEGRVTTNLFDALTAAVDDGTLSPQDRVRLAWDLADIFAWQVDFSRDLHAGDEFRVVAERLEAEDGEIRYSRVQAAELTVSDREYTAYRWTATDGSTGFYDAEGHSLRRAFLLAPVAFRRISSRLSTSRLHPILGIIRKHEGIDFAADAGTPVMAAGDGVVVRRGWTAGYGNLIEIQHTNGIITRYGHLRDFAEGIMEGLRVRQGQVIGHVGSTGLATGPHLHYEFRVNGVARDPRSADLGTGDPVPLAEWRLFDEERARLAVLLTGVGTRYAAGDFPLSAQNRPSAGASF
jgi:murein DD-endopeptidase MepM/ murein hydrolase activator NlpD